MDERPRYPGSDEEAHASRRDRVVDFILDLLTLSGDLLVWLISLPFRALAWLLGAFFEALG